MRGSILPIIILATTLLGAASTQAADLSVAEANAIPTVKTLEQQLICNGKYKNLRSFFPSFKIAKLTGDETAVYRDAKLFGISLAEVGYDWMGDANVPVTFAVFNAKQRVVTAALLKAGANLKNKKPPYIEIMPYDGGTRTAVACAWDRVLEIP